jgi:hypothetical protein
MTNQNDGTSTGGQPVTGAPPIIKAEPENPVPSKPATEADLEQVKNQMSGFERSTLGWTRASFIVILATGIFIALQWHEMHSGGQDTHDLAIAAKTQADKMKSMSDAADKIRQAAENMVIQDQRIADNAEKSLKASNKQSKAVLDANVAASRLDQRAWVGVSGAELTQFEANKPLHLDVALLNTGKTPARKTRECTGWVLARGYLREPPNDVITKCEKDWKASSDLPPQGKFITRAGEAQLGASPEDQGSAVYIMQSYDAIKGKVQILYVFGEYEYQDLTGQTRTTRYCLYLSDPDTKTVQFCDGFNDMN